MSFEIDQLEHSLPNRKSEHSHIPSELSTSKGFVPVFLNAILVWSRQGDAHGARYNHDNSEKTVAENSGFLAIFKDVILRKY